MNLLAAVHLTNQASQSFYLLTDCQLFEWSSHSLHLANGPSQTDSPTRAFLCVLVPGFAQNGGAPSSPSLASPTGSASATMEALMGAAFVPLH
jgi:hypothetical protein